MTVRHPSAHWRALLAPGLMTAFGLAVLIGLGVWQIERLRWKQDLVATLSERLSAAPIPLPPPAAWPRLRQPTDEFLRVRFSAQFLNDKEALVFTAGSRLRPDIAGSGYWVFTPARLAGGAVVMVDRGFVPVERMNPATRAQGQIAGMHEIIGALRWPEQRSAFTPDDRPDRNMWFARDPEAVAAAKNVGPVPPFYVAQEAPAPPGGLPRVGRLEPNLPNNHLQYALTWFGLALALVGVFAMWLMRRRADGAGQR